MPRPNRKRQTQLSFSPLPSSSPAAADYPHQSKKRAASVRYGGSQRLAKRRRLDNDIPRSILSPTSSSPEVDINDESSPKPSKETQDVKSSMFKMAALPTPVASSQIEVTDLQESSSEDEVPLPTSRKLFRRSKTEPLAPQNDNKDSSSSEEIITPARRRRPQPNQTPNRSETSSNKSEDEIRKDAEDLQDNETRGQRTRGSQRTPKKTKAAQQLELIRRRRSGQQIVELSSDSDACGAAASRKCASEKSREESSSDEDSESSENCRDHLFSRANEDPDKYEDDFVIDDEEDVGAPDILDEMPFEFTRHAHKKPIEHFKDVVEWMVHNKLNPAFPRNDPVYRVAVLKLDDEVKGMAGSKFISSVWRPNFFSALKERPEVTYLETPGMLEHCAACGRSNHPAKYQLIFSGRPYDRDSLESVSDDEDDDNDSEKAFYVGRTCCANAETAHALQHWRYALNQYVIEWLQRHGHLRPAKIVEREKWSTKRRGQYANGIVDGMESSGEMKVLYKEFKENLQAARDAKNDRYEYGRR